MEQSQNNSQISEISQNSQPIEEEMLVYVDIEPTALSESPIQDVSCLKMLVNKKSMLLQINNRFFQGKF